MAGQVYVRPYSPEKDARRLVAWLHASREKNRYDPEIFLKGQVTIETAIDETGTLGFIPRTNVFLIESLALRPDLSPITEAKVLQAWQHALVRAAFEQNISDAFFVTFDETILAFAQRHGWQKVVVPMLNLHFSDLEPKEVSDGRPVERSEG